MNAIRAMVTAVVLALAFAGCGRAPGAGGAGVAAGATSDDASPVAESASPAAEGAGAYADTTVILVEASPDEIEAARAKMAEDEFATVADDLSFYRASARAYLEKRNIPFVDLTGRRPLEFVVDGAVKRYAYADQELLDFIVLYDGRHEPRMIATNEVEQVGEFLGRAH